MGIQHCMCSDRPSALNINSFITQSHHFSDSGIVFNDFTKIFGPVSTVESLETALRSVVPQKMSLNSPNGGGSVLRLTCVKISKQTFHLVVIEIILITLETHINVYPANHRLLGKNITGSLVLQGDLKAKDLDLSTIPEWIARNKFTCLKLKGKAMFKYLKSLNEI